MILVTILKLKFGHKFEVYIGQDFKADILSRF